MQLRLSPLRLGDKPSFLIIGVEDIIIHRLESAVSAHQEHPEWSDDYDWAKRMFEIHKEDPEILNLEYLQKASSDIVVINIIKKWLN